ncbi:hypothetical protein EDD11_006596 [Mortierella claussenii]|nr:hypothetical protein EDD11_006596 [Mortierella claussenii]
MHSHTRHALRRVASLGTRTLASSAQPNAALSRICFPAPALDLLGCSSSRPFSRSFLTRTPAIHSRSPHSASSATSISVSSLRPYHISIRTLDQQRKSLADDPVPNNNSVKTHTHDHSCNHNHNCNHSHHDHEDDSIQRQQANPIPPNTDPKARMLIGFTCTVCNNRAHKTMSKHAYEHGVVIMQCDHCKNRHLIADHLGWFKNGGVNVEDLVKQNGETVRKLTRSYQLVKNGEEISSGEEAGAMEQQLHVEAETGAGEGSPSAGSSSSSSSLKKEPKSELELALERAAEGMLEWIPKEILEQEEERMKKSQELLDQSKKKE